MLKNLNFETFKEGWKKNLFIFKYVRNEHKRSGLDFAIIGIIK